MSKKRTSKCDLPSADWDFSKVKDEELFRCWTYEFSREVDWLITQYKSGKPDAHYDSCHAWWYPVVLDREEGASFYVWLPPGFPERPFLTLLREYRDEPPSSFPEDFMAYFPELDGRAVYLAETKEAKSSSFCYPICINWSLHDKVIAEKFRSLLTKLSPKGRHVETRGKANSRRLRKELKALGAYRLLGECNADRAIRYTEERLEDKKPLYSEEARWSTAKTLAQKVLKQHFTQRK